MLSRTEIQAYLNRIGIRDIEPPSLSFLSALHRAHVAHISWQTLDIYTGRPSSMDVQVSTQLMIQNRSGYCFHLNGAFGTLLRALGFEVSWHRAGVQPTGQEPRVNDFHLGVTVCLPNDEGVSERWIVDVGLGDMPFDPLPLARGMYTQGHYTYEVLPSGVVDGGWRLAHDPLGPFTGVDYAPEVIEGLDRFVPKHEFYSQSAESPWIDAFIIRQRNAVDSNELRGCMWKRWDVNGVSMTEINQQSDWLDVLDAVFKERLVAYSKLERDELWKRVREQHEKWKRQKLEGNSRD